jgi:serine protease
MWLLQYIYKKGAITMTERTTNQGDKNKPIEEDPNYLPRIVVKFRDGVIKTYEDEAERQLEEAKIGWWGELQQQYPGITLRRLYTSLAPQELEVLMKRAQEGNPDYRPPNLLTFFALNVPPDRDPEALLKDLAARDEVEHVYIEGKPAPPPLGNVGATARIQGYLSSVPGGIDAEFVQSAGIPGGDGAGTSFIDIEQGWTLNHDALQAANITLISGMNRWYRGHGTAVLGQLVAGQNTRGIVGIAPQAHGRVASIWPPSPTDPNIPDVNSNIPNAIAVATMLLGPGDVMVIEVQIPRGSLLLPCEIELATFINIQIATTAGIIVVEAAGNGDLGTNQGVDLDTISNSVGMLAFDPNVPDSGAIMVAAASSTEPHIRLDFSNFGQRIDCYAWGEAVATTGDGWSGSGTADYTDEFNGTSSATPIIAGVALVMQGIARARGLNIRASQARAILRDSANGTPPDPMTEPIGVMPDLKKISAVVLAM